MTRMWIAIGCVLMVMATVVQAQESSRVQGFSVVLILGEAQGSVPSQGLSAPAQKALAEIRDFLPYKGYRVLDTQWVAGSAFGNSRGRIRGIDQKDYEFKLDTFPNDVGAARPGAPGALSQARFQLTTPAMGFTTSGGKLGVETLLDSTFAIKSGETVVVGTSRVQGDTALIVLLTAVAGK